jgi:hypothetical protein
MAYPGVGAALGSRQLNDVAAVGAGTEPLTNFVAIDRDLGGRIDAHSDLIAGHPQDFHADV